MTKRKTKKKSKIRKKKRTEKEKGGQKMFRLFDLFKKGAHART